MIKPVQMEFWTGLFIVLGLFSVAVISPGPDFLVVIRNALAHGRIAGFMTALGISIAIYFHIAYCMLGIALLVSQSILLFNIIKLAGAAYLIWLGYKALKSKGWQMKANMDEVEITDKKPNLSYFRDGLLTNMLNPKATLFFMALFTQVITPTTPLSWQLSYGTAMVICALGWFSFVSIALTQRRVRQSISKISVWIDRVTGVLFIALGLKIALSRH